MESNISGAVLAYLFEKHTGRKNAIKAKCLADNFNTSLREINETIRILRKDGKLIGSSKLPPFGYYIPANEQEKIEYLDCFKNELMDMLETFNKQRHAQRLEVETSEKLPLFSGKYDEVLQP